jgi:copper(I)-binding protein
MLKHITAKELSQRAAKTLKANPTKLKARNAKISVRQKTFVQNNPEAVKAKVKLMNATCRGATKENNVGIQKQVANRRVKHLAKMNSIMADMQLLDWQTMKQKELASKLHTSVPTAQRMIAMLKKGQTYWALT